MKSFLRVGVYIDGYNLYYGGKKLCQGQQAWKWLDIRGLINDVTSRYSGWEGFEVSRIVYCTAEIADNREAHARQQKYCLALRSSGSVDEIVYGEFRAYAKESLVAVKRKSGFELVAFDSDPLPSAKWTRLQNESTHLLVSHRRRDEKGSDVNIASNLLIDVLEGSIDAAIVISNDSDLYAPVIHARSKVPVGMINPRGTPTAGKLRGLPSDGVGHHWWYKLTAEDLLNNQLPDHVGKYVRPDFWRNV